MKRYAKDFLLRGFIFGGFGPIILGIIYAILEGTLENFSLDGWQVLVAILSTYLLAFFQAGGSVFNQIEEWSLPKSLFCHFSLLYVCYVLCYLVNSWIPFEIGVVAIFTLVFAAVYAIIWLTVFLAVKGVSRKLNGRLRTPF